MIANTFIMTAASMNSTLTRVTFYRNGKQTMVGNQINENGNATTFKDLSDGVTMGAATDPVCAWQGDIAEELIYDHQLTPTEMQFVWFHLSNKYGIHQADTPQPSAQVATPAVTTP